MHPQSLTPQPGDDELASRLSPALSIRAILRTVRHVARSAILLAVGCHGGAPPPAVSPEAAVAIEPPRSGSVEEPAPGVEPSRRSALPEPFAVLGALCSELPPVATQRVLCDRRGRVAGVRVPVDLVQGVPPASAERIHAEEQSGIPRGTALVVALEGERLWIRRVTCSMCRRVLGWSFVGDLERLEDADLRELQSTIGLPPSPLLRSREDWRRAYASSP
jgi:hypothetical protein